MSKFSWLFVLGWALLLTLSAPPQTATAQFGDLFGGSSDSNFGVSQEPLTIEASFHPIGETQQAVLEVKAIVGIQYHVYSVTQKDGRPSVITLNGANAKIVSKFVPDREPEKHGPGELDFPTEVHNSNVTWQALIEFPEGKKPAEQVLDVHYSGLVCDEESMCRPIELDVTAKSANTIPKAPQKVIDAVVPEDLSADDEAEDATPATLPVGEDEISVADAKVTGWTDKSFYQPGDRGTITIRVELKNGFHTYPSASPEERVAEYAPTLIGVLEVTGGKSVADFNFQSPKANQEPHIGTLGIPQFDDSVQWELEFTIPADSEEGQLAIHGVMQSQTCDEASCNVPVQLRWHAGINVGLVSSPDGSNPKFQLVWGECKKSAKSLLTDPEKATAFLDDLLGRSLENQDVLPPTFASEDAFDVSALKPQPFHKTSNYSLPTILAIALLGGFILNFMPCVLPVIGLKILSLVEQAGESRSKALGFNLVYVLGMLSVFWILAILISTKEFGWGSQFSSTLFNVTFSAVVFAMALSYLEVWEITLPSFVGVQSSKLDQKDGWVGTFFKGAVTTILATPCSGPGLATALAWCADKPVWIILIVFTFLGLGMGLPYLLVALFPPIIAFLPKPGPWMNTFKQLMGFVLLGTVAFFLFTVDMEYLFPAICFLMVVWFACWLVGRLTFSSKPITWVGTWASALLVIVGSSYFIFGWQVSKDMNQLLGGDFNQRFASNWNLISAQQYRLNSFVNRQITQRRSQPASEQEDKIQWVPFSLQALEHYTNGENPKTVFIDFTADWCANCKAFERVVLHSEDVEKRLSSDEVIAMIADKTLTNKEIDSLLNSLGAGNQIPLYAVFPKGKANQPRTIDGTSISIANVHTFLDEAGVSSAAALKGTKQKGGKQKGEQSGETQIADSDPPMLDELEEEDGLPLPPETEGQVTASTDASM